MCLWISSSYWLKRWAHGWIDCCWNQKVRKEERKKLRAGGTRLTQLLAHTVHTHTHTYNTHCQNCRCTFFTLLLRFVWFGLVCSQAGYVFFSFCSIYGIVCVFFRFYSFKLMNVFLSSSFINILKYFNTNVPSVRLFSILHPCWNIPFLFRTYRT